MDIKSKKIELVDVNSLVPHPKNPNKHPKDQIDRLKKIIEYQGFRNPITVQKGTNLIVCGHGRLEAAKEIGYKEVPVIEQEFESEEQLYAHMVADNAIADWAKQDLAQINVDIQDLGPELNIDMLGFEDFTIEPLDSVLPDIGDGSDPDIQSMTFILSNEQVDIVNDALRKAEQENDCSDGINQNSNGNKLAMVCKIYAQS